jgi:hypothetical protein
VTLFSTRFRRAVSLTAGIIVAGSLSVLAYADSPNDVVPRGSGAYEALATLAAGRLLPGDAESFVGTTARLRTRGELASMVDSLRDNVDPASVTPNEEAALDFLAHYLADPQVSDHTPSWRTNSGYAGTATGEAGAVKDNGNKQKAYADALGTLRVFGTTSGDITYTAGVTNRYQQRDEYVSFNTRNGGVTPDNDIRQRSGLDDAYVTWTGSHGLQINVGVKDRRWGPGYSGDMQVSDNAPAHPGVELDAPIWLGHQLKLFRFSQVQEAYTTLGKYMYVGYRRLEHPMGSQWDLDLQESYSATKIRSAAILVLPFYAYQKFFIHDNNLEPAEFNYNVSAGLTYRPGGESGDSMAYLQFFIDDIQSPKGIGLGNKVRRKVAYLVGYNHTFTASGTNLVVEYVRSDPQTYTKPDPGYNFLAWFANDLPLAHPIGANGQEVYGRIGQKLGDRFDVSVGGLVRRRLDSSFPAPNDALLTAALAYHLDSSHSLAVRYADFREDPYNGSVVVVQPTGGADYGAKVREKLVGVDYMLAF